VISVFIDRMLRGKSITINGRYQSRDFIYVKDIVNAIDKAVFTANTDVMCEQVNNLTGRLISVSRIADMLIEAVGAKVDKYIKSFLLVILSGLKRPQQRWNDC
jgi:nucleoside-diphosphate-sugar epimerase